MRDRSTGPTAHMDRKMMMMMMMMFKVRSAHAFAVVAMEIAGGSQHELTKCFFEEAVPESRKGPVF